MSSIDTPKKTIDLNRVINKLIMNMRVDYIQQFEKLFPNEESVTHYRERLQAYLKNKELIDIMTAYSNYVMGGNKFLPNIPELLEHIDDAAKNRRRIENNCEEAIRIGNTPAPTIECQPLEMLKTARDALRQKQESSEERMINRAAALKAHEELLNAHSDKIRRKYANNDQLCTVGHCNKPGSLSHGTTGGGNFYCSEHIRGYL